MAPPPETLTYEEVTKIFRREKSSKAITDVRRDLYPSIRECLEKLKHDGEREFAIDPLSPKSKSLAGQMTKFQEKVAQIFEFRMEKILQMSLRSAVGNKVDVSKLTIEEKEIYDDVFLSLKERRLNMVEGQRFRPATEAEEVSPVQAKPKIVQEAEAEEEVFDAPGPLTSVVEANIKQAQQVHGPVAGTRVPQTIGSMVEQGKKRETADVPKGVPVPEVPSVSMSTDYIVLRMIEDVPTFAAPGRSYRLQKEDMVTLPPAIAKALVLRKKAIGVQISGPSRPN